MESAILTINDIDKLISDGSEVYQQVIAHIEPIVFERALIRCHGNQTKACEILGINRGTLRKKLKAAGKIK